MSTWGVGNLENDDALDWLEYALVAGDPGVVCSTLARVRDAGDDLVAPIAAEALAAAEVVATDRGHGPLGRLEPQLSSVAQGAAGLAGKAELALAAIETVVDANRSELYAIWHEDPVRGGDWDQAIEDLRARLRAVPNESSESIPPLPQGGTMSGDKTDRVRGKVKEGVGETTGDRALAEQGRREQAKGDIKKAGKKVKDAAKR